MSEQEDLAKIKHQIQFARSYIRSIQENRVNLACVLAGVYGSITVELEFPEPDIAHVYQCMFGHREHTPTVYRLSFGRQLKWVGVSHPWGMKPTDIICDEEPNG